jgi:hypothetical protein
MAGDPELASLVERALSRRSIDHRSALDISKHISSLVRLYLSLEYSHFNVEKRWKLEVYYRNDETLFGVDALQDRLLAQRRSNRTWVLKIEPESRGSKYFTNKAVTPIFDGLQYCSVFRALKFCRLFSLKDFEAIIEHEVGDYQQKRKAYRGMRELVVEEELQIAYYVPTMMINFTHIAEAIGWKGAYLKKMAKPAILRDVSHDKLGGTYIDKKSCESFLNSGDYSLLLPLDKLESS